MALRILPVILAGALLFTPLTASAEDAPPPSADAPAAADQAAKEQPKCRKAAVNPVTGHAVCLEPRGVPVDSPPPEAFNRPCPPRAHDDEPGTIYERYSGC